MLKKSVAVILSGCGVYDGTECMEASAQFFALHEHKFSFQCYAPNQDHFHILNHTNGEEMDQKRNVMIESARLCRGNIKPLEELKSGNYDALFMPGGFGAAKNLSSFGYKGMDMTVDPVVSNVVKDFHSNKKWIAACCISPIVLSCALGKVNQTLGNTGDKWPYQGSMDVAKSFGTNLEMKNKDEVLVDADNKIVTAPAFMYDHDNYHELYLNVREMVMQVRKNM